MIREAWIPLTTMMTVNPHLWDGLQVPEGVDKDTAINKIVLECNELELLYNEPEFLQNAIKMWCDVELPVWEELYKTTQYEYNPIWNKDGTHVELETRDLHAKGQAVHDVKGFNSNSWADSDKDDSTGQDWGTIKHEYEEHGNIGVTTTQQMIKEQREVVEFNIYKRILDDFKNAFCLLIY